MFLMPVPAVGDL